MLRRIVFLGCVFLAVVFLGPVLATAEILFESGTLGRTGVRSADVFDQQIVPGSNVDSASFQGVRFFIGQPSITTRVGGHFVTGPSMNGMFFGAIVRLEDELDFPDSSDLSTPDVLGDTLLTFSEPSNEVFGNLTLLLPPGWYSLVFGAGLFSAIGNGAILRNNNDLGSPDYIGFAQGFGWGNRLPGKRLVVEGSVVPEPSAIVLSAMSLCLILLFPRTGFRLC